MWEVKPGFTKRTLAPVSGMGADDRVLDGFERRQHFALPAAFASRVEQTLELLAAVTDRRQCFQEALKRPAQALERRLLVGDRLGLLPDLTTTRDHVLRRGQFAQGHRPAGMQLLGADTNLGPEPELLAVGEPR